MTVCQISKKFAMNGRLARRRKKRLAKPRTSTSTMVDNLSKFMGKVLIPGICRIKVISRMVQDSRWSCARPATCRYGLPAAEWSNTSLWQLSELAVRLTRPSVSTTSVLGV